MTDIYKIRLDGTGKTRLSDQTANFGSPQWSPDDKTIIFSRNIINSKNPRQMTAEERENSRNSNEIYMVDADGGNLKNLTNNNLADAFPNWSKDGKTVYFLSNRENAFNIYRMNRDGSNVQKVTDGSLVSEPVISPDEKFFAFSKKVNDKWGIFIYDLQTKQVRLIVGAE